MRKIKFRAWDKNKNKMYINLNHYQQNFGIARDGEFEENDYILMQYTGLKDKNGKEIYEGDLLSGRDWLTKTLLNPYQVKFAENRTFMADEYGITITGFYMVGKEDNDFYWSVNPNYEVIGSIYENKDLL